VAATLTLDEHLERFAREQVATGRYASVDAVVAAALNLLRERAEEDAAKLEELDRMLQAAVDDVEAGRVRPAKDVFDEIEARLKKRIASSD
jgi:antitoxin ParD1/3/4